MDLDEIDFESCYPRLAVFHYSSFGETLPHRNVVASFRTDTAVCCAFAIGRLLDFLAVPSLFFSRFLPHCSACFFSATCGSYFCFLAFACVVVHSTFLATNAQRVRGRKHCNKVCSCRSIEHGRHGITVGPCLHVRRCPNDVEKHHQV